MLDNNSPPDAPASMKNPEFVVEFQKLNHKEIKVERHKNLIYYLIGIYIWFFSLTYDVSTDFLHIRIG